MNLAIRYDEFAPIVGSPHGSLIGKIACAESRKEAPFFEQDGRRPVLDDLTIFYDKHPVKIHNHFDVMGNRDEGLSYE
jgi:hypothetical protein